MSAGRQIVIHVIVEVPLKRLPLAVEMIDLPIRNTKGRFWPVLLLALLLWQSQGDAWRLLWFQLDRDSFASRYCENLDAPQLDCRGSCQLEYLSPGADSPQEDVLPPGPDMRQFIPYLEPVTADLKEITPESNNRSLHDYVFFYSCDYSLTLLRPPASGLFKAA